MRRFTGPKIGATFFPFLFSLVFLVTPALKAEYIQFDQVLQMSLGGTTGANRYTEMQAAGIDLGLAYRIYPFQATRYSLGAEIGDTSFEDRPSGDSQARMDVNMLSAGAFLRFDMTPTSPVMSYLSAGGQVREATQDIHETDGATTTNTATRGGYFLGVGFESPFSDDWRIGAELRTLGGSEHFVEAITGKMTLSYVWTQY